MKRLAVHEACELFPRLEGEEFAALVADIRQHGLLETIKLLDGRIVDGRNRYLACMELGIEPRTEVLASTVDPFDYAFSQNFHRRHLTTEQRAAIASEWAQRHKRPGVKHPRTDSSTKSNAPTADEASKRFNVGRTAVQQATTIRNRTPDVADGMRAGKYGSVEAAARVSKALLACNTPKNVNDMSLIQRAAFAAELAIALGRKGKPDDDLARREISVEAMNLFYAIEIGQKKPEVFEQMKRNEFAGMTAAREAAGTVAIPKREPRAMIPNEDGSKRGIAMWNYFKASGIDDRRQFLRRLKTNGFIKPNGHINPSGR